MMREPVDLRRAVKEGVGRDLADLTFTPAMQERVLARLHKRPHSRLTWLYPASAAAAVLLILVTSTSHLTNRGTEKREMAADSAKRAAPVAPGGTELRTDTSAATTSSSPPPSPLASPAPPPLEKDKALPAEATQEQAGVTAYGQPEGSFKALGGPGIASTKMNGRAAVTGPQLAAVPAEHLVVTLTSGAVTRVDLVGAPIWQVALPASKKAEQVIAAPNGKLVVGASSTVLLLGPDGSMLESLQVADPVLQIAAGTSDRLALVSERAVYVRHAAGQPLVALAEANVSAATFTPDGLVLLVTPQGLTAYESNGSRRWFASGEGGALLVSPDGKAILWGNNLYDPNGVLLPSLEPAPGAAAGGPGLLRWDGEQLKAFTWAGKRSWSWTAPGFIASVIQGEGDRIWVITDTPEGVKLQGLQGSTGRPVGKAQSLPAIPQEAIALDGKLYLRLPEGLTILPL